jgi:hypothetical protein
MTQFTLIAQRIPVQHLLNELDANPDLWDDRPERRFGESPHRETSDIWVRYADPHWLARTGDFSGPHQSVWWPAVDRIPSLFAIWDRVRFALGGPLEFGGVLITRIPPGCQVYPHHDRGTWHAEHYTTKVWLPLRANGQCINGVEDEEMVWRPGEAWSHDNLLTHWVRNEGATERICLIMCFRRITTSQKNH